MSEHLVETFEGGIATLTMNRPEARNAMSGEMMAAMSEAVPRLASDPEVRCVVLTGAGNAFCAGGDVKGFAARNAGAGGGRGRGPSIEQAAYGLRQGMEVSRQLHEMPKPTLAVIPGACAGAGLSLALACDLRVAVSDAKLTTAFARIGASGDYGGSWFLPRLVGAAKARELYFLSDVISGEEAAELGLVNHAWPREAFEARAAELAARLAASPTVALGFMKRNLNAADHAALPDVLDLEADHMTRSMRTEDHKAAAQAFVDKRPPQFSGR